LLVAVVATQFGLCVYGLHQEAQMERLTRRTTWCPTPAQRQEADPWRRHFKIEEGIEHRWLHHAQTACDICDKEGGER